MATGGIHDHNCVVALSQAAECWGYGGLGELGIGSQANSNVPKIVKGVGGIGQLNQVTSVTTGEDHSCALLVNTQVVCWGLNNEGELGNGQMLQGVVKTPVYMLAF
jgi:alpha-tubulin suppressor-like RCC1 family protein